MIEKLKKITIICQQKDSTETLEKLRDLGVLHIAPSILNISDDLVDVRTKKDKVIDMINYLTPHADEENSKHEFKEYDDKQTLDLLLEAHQAVTDMRWFEENSENHNRIVQQLRPWGNFEGKKVQEMREKGLFVYFCETNEKDLEKLLPKLTDFNIFTEIIKIETGTAYFIVISQEPVKINLPETNLHLETSLKELKEREKITQETEDALRGKLQIFANYLPRYQEILEKLEDKEEFFKNRDGMIKTGSLSYLVGYAPVEDEEEIKKLAQKNGLALLFENADPESLEVPTKLKTPKFAKITQPLFRFLGITPGYSETDVSVPMLIFLALFFAMLIGDAGYGTIFLIVSLIFSRKMIKQGKSVNLALKLFMFFATSTIIWGFLNGTFFAITKDKLPSFMQGFQWFTNQHTQLLCFIIAAVQLSFARLWKAKMFFHFPRKMLANIGWAIFIWGNFFTACYFLNILPYYDFSMNLYIIGGSLILIFGVKWNDIGNIINTPFNFIASFVDVLSYIRLFAVGFASLKIAESFNVMGSTIFAEGGVNILLGCAVVLMGHLLNITLGFMAVLVHGVRLNTLEFSNHMEITWSGIFFKPFKLNNNN